MTAKATYEILIDWDNDGGLNIGNFEGSFDGWVANGTTPPILDLVSTQYHLGTQSCRVTWTAYTPSGGADSGVEVQFDTAGRGFDQGRFAGGDASATVAPSVNKVFTNLVVGRAYTLSTWVYVPSSGGIHVNLAVVGIATSSPSTLTDQWQKISVAFTASANAHIFRLSANTNPAGGELSFFDESMVIGPGEDVSARVLGVRTPLSMGYGRDSARSIGAVAPGDITIEINNRSRDYSPDNPGSVIAGFLGAGKAVIVKATYAGLTHVLFNGFLDNYTIAPDFNTKSVTFTALDILSRLSGNISTEVFPVLRTGDGVHKILDAVGWPTDKRIIDPGATVMTYWSEENNGGQEALESIMNSEGPPAFAFVDFAGNFVFRDRHHRVLQAASVNSQATLRSDGAEPNFSAPVSYEIGWKDIINSVTVAVDQREPGEFQNVFESSDSIVIQAGSVYVFSIQADAPFVEAITPVAGTDYALVSGTVNVILSRTSGQSCDISVTAITTARIDGMNLRARPIVVARTYSISIEDSSSIKDNGLKTFPAEIPWAGINDVQAIGSIILGQRSQRLPVITVTVNNGNSTRLNQILTRDLSDRVHIVEPETFTDHDHFIERMEHTISDVGASHTASFACERVRTQTSPVFTFDDAAKGFNLGKFGYQGLDDAASVFVLDVSALDTGLLGT